MIEKTLLVFLICKGSLTWEMGNREVGVSLVFGQRKVPKWIGAVLGRLCMGASAPGAAGPVAFALHSPLTAHPQIRKNWVRSGQG